MSKTQVKGTSAMTSITEAEQANSGYAATAADGRHSPGTSSDPGDIITAIKELKEGLKGDNDNLRLEIKRLGQEINGKLDKLTTDVQGLSDRVDETESRVERVEAWAAEATEAFCSCLEQHETLQRKLTDLESRSRRNNLHIFGVAEGEEGNSVSQFIEGLLRRELPLPQDLDLKIQRAHRAPAFKPRPEAPPRPIIINFQEFTTKELVLKEAWKKGKIQLSNRTLFFDHDYAAEIVKRRKEYGEIKKVLKGKGIRFQTPYTSMRIHWSTGVRTYSSAAEVMRELKNRGFPVEEPARTEKPCCGAERLRELLGWQQVPGRRERGSAAAQRARDKLQEFQRGHTE